ncbi:metal ABC transporter substrate-binding protein [Nitrososphaera viennensis]|uniref:Metal ABC transporter substrate-binding protein n=1 Tax=Nitrososphaera viennensis TaxID=1034015 RepID=A0A977IB66_9ARCH|nr:metal ABC transporter substrate-binding protein [Nitrososphaera viennensis]UVS67739.1 metal ABC transporter substrate-binding protein [Nitrososphaera viennensis]
MANAKAIGIIAAIVVVAAIIGVAAMSAGANPVPTPASVESEKLAVVTSVAPITNIVRNVGGDRIQLTGLVPEGVNSHTFELAPSDSIAVGKADLVIINGLHLETDIERVAQAAGKPDLQILRLADSTITRDQWVFDFSFPEEGGDPNPHLWLNVAHAIKYAQLVRDKLVEMDPGNADYYRANADRYLALLQRLDQGIMASVQTIPAEQRKLLTYHDSWAYFAPRYGMKVIGAVQPSDFGEPTPQEVASIIDQIRQEKVPAIFASEVFQSKVVDQIAKEANVQVVETLRDDALPGNAGEPGHTYVGMMLENMRNMIVPLGGNVDALSDIDPADTYTGDL